MINLSLCFKYYVHGVNMGKLYFGKIVYQKHHLDEDITNMGTMTCDPTKPLIEKQEATHCVMVLFFMTC